MKKTILFGLVLIIMTSCNFEEVCHYTGAVDISVDWKNVSKSEMPSSIYSIFYSENFPAQKFFFSKDTIINNIEVGKQKVIAFTAIPNPKIEFQAMDKLATARIILPTYIINNKTYTIDAPMMYVDNTSLEVEADETTNLFFCPAPGIQKIIFEFIIIRNNCNTEVSEIKAELSGIPYSYSLSKMKAERNAASIKFPTKKERNDFFTGNCQLLGINPHVDGNEDINKELRIDILMDDQSIISQNINMTNVVEGVNNNILTCKIEIHINNLKCENISISDWATGNFGDIQLK